MTPRVSNKCRATPHTRISPLSLRFVFYTHGHRFDSAVLLYQVSRVTCDHVCMRNRSRRRTAPVRRSIWLVVCLSSSSSAARDDTFHCSSCRSFYSCALKATGWRVPACRTVSFGFVWYLACSLPFLSSPLFLFRSALK